MTDTPRCGAHVRQCPEHGVRWALCEHGPHDVKACEDNAHACKMWAGQGTDHPGVGNCKVHLGSVRTGRKSAKMEAARRALKALGIPVAGSPIEVMQAAVDGAYGVLIAARDLLVNAGDGEVEIYLRQYLDALERTARIAKPAADLKLDEERIALAQTQYRLFHELLDVYAVAIGATEEQRAAGDAAVIARIRERRVVLPESTILH
jgi:hypothetical protein